MGDIYFFCFCRFTCLSISQSHKFNLTYCLKSPCFLHFTFCLFVWLLKLMYPPSISPLGLFQWIIYNIERLKGGTLEPWVNWKGRPDVKPWTSDPSSCHVYHEVDILKWLRNSSEKKLKYVKSKSGYFFQVKEGFINHWMESINKKISLVLAVTVSSSVCHTYKIKQEIIKWWMYVNKIMK